MLKSRGDDGSDPEIEYFRRGSAASRLGPRDYCATSRHLHVTGIAVAVSPSTRELVFEMAADARAAGRTWSFDPNLRPSPWRSQGEMVECLNRLASFSDWVVPGLQEGRLLTGRDTPQGIADFFLERGARGVFVKVGPDGDGFAVGVVSGLLEDLSAADAAARGNAIGARVVQFPVDCDGLPTREQLNAAGTGRSGGTRVDKAPSESTCRFPALP